MADLEALLSLESRSFAYDTLSRRSLRRFLQTPGACVLVAETAEGLAGYALVTTRRNSLTARLYSLATADSARGQGIGAMLLKAAEDAARLRERTALRLEVHDGNEPALHLYRNRGYRAIGTREDYYTDHARALLFEKDLTAEKHLEEG